MYAEFHLRRGDIEKARSLLPRSLQSLEKRKRSSSSTIPLLLELIALQDLKTISRFAQLEYKMAEPERGKTLFEGIIDSHPKRWDIWSIYMDMEAGQGNMATLRFVNSLTFNASII